MIVVDASAALDYLLRDEASFDWIAPRLAEEPVAAPHLLDTEVAHALRKHVAGRRLDGARAAEALAALGELPLERYAARPLLSRIWQLRHNVSAYDATYIALAEALDAVFVTIERRLLDLPVAASPVRIDSPHGTRG